MILENTDYYRISIDPNVPCLEWIALKPMKSNIFRESEIKLRDQYIASKKRYKSLNLYIDARNIGLISTADTSWVAEEILPLLAEAGLRKEAFVVSEEGLKRLIVSNFINKAGVKVEIKKFSNEIAAKEYLRQ